MSRVLFAITGIAITCLSTFIIFMGWFYIREEVLGNRDDLIAMMIQMIVCAGLLFVGCGASIVHAIIGDRDQPPLKQDKKPPTVQGDSQSEQD